MFWIWQSNSLLPYKQECSFFKVESNVNCPGRVTGGWSLSQYLGPQSENTLGRWHVNHSAHIFTHKGTLLISNGLTCCFWIVFGLWGCWHRHKMQAPQIKAAWFKPSWTLLWGNCTAVYEATVLLMIMMGSHQMVLFYLWEKFVIFVLIRQVILVSSFQTLVKLSGTTCALNAFNAQQIRIKYLNRPWYKVLYIMR